MVQLSVGEQLSGTPYRVVEAVGSGGMGSVFEVEHAELGKRFVLKVLHHHLASRSDLVGRMRNEWRALAKLNHPSIVQVTDAGQLPSGLPYYVMEKLEGRNLGQWIAQQGRLAPAAAGGIMSDVLDALHAAHSTGAIHRDVKPQNIFVLENGRAKLLDFGIAKLKDRAARVVTAGGVSIGTPRYMAPEQAEGKTVDGRADIYAAGLVLYEAIAGKGPFAHIRDANELVLAHIGIDPMRLDEATDDVSPEWGDLVQRWLSKRPCDRPASAGIAAIELRALLQATASSAPGTESEVTLGGIYDAETVGSPASELSHVDAASPAVQGRSLGVASTDQVAVPPKGDAAPRTMGLPGTAQVLPSTAQVSPRAAQGTLGWGTTEAELTGTQTMRPDLTERAVASRPPLSGRPPTSGGPGSASARRSPSGSGRAARPSASGAWAGTSARPQTPPPVSSTRRPTPSWWDRLTPVQKNVVTVVGAAVGSFTLAWLAVHTYSNIQSDLAAQSASPAGPDRGALTAAPARSVPAVPTPTALEAAPPAAASSVGSVSKSAEISKTAEISKPAETSKPAVAQAAVPKKSPAGSLSSPRSTQTAPSAPPVKSTASARADATAVAPSPSLKKTPAPPAAKTSNGSNGQLPGSGLW